MRKDFLPGTGRDLLLPVLSINTCMGQYAQSQDCLARDRRLGWFQFLEYWDCLKAGHGYDWPVLARVLLTGPT